MVRRLLVGRQVASVTALLLAAGGPADAQSKLPPTVAAVIDYQRILRDAKAARSIREQVEARRKLYQDEIAKEEQRLHEVDKELAAQRRALGRGILRQARSVRGRGGGGAAHGAGASAPAGPGLPRRSTRCAPP